MRCGAAILLCVGILSAAAEKDPRLQAQWSFDELSGCTAADASGHGYDGLISGKSVWTQGKRGGALEFGDGRSYVDAKLPWKPESYTFSAWARPTAIPRDMPASICGRPGWSTDIGYNQKGNFYFEASNTEKQTCAAVSPAVYAPGAWHHVVGTFDSGSSKLLLFVDGERVAESVFSGTLYSYPDEFYIGCSKPTSQKVPYWFTGSVDEVKVYARAITDAEVRTDYESLKDALGPAEDARYGAVGQSTQPLWMDPPVEKPAPVSDQLVETLKNRPPASARVVSRADGPPRLEINGAATPLLGVDTFENAFNAIYLAPFFDAGMEIVNVTINLAYSEKNGSGCSSTAMFYMKPYWIGKKQYDSAELGKLLWRSLQTNPNAKLILWIQVDPYPEWPSEHPDDLMRNEKGEALVAERHFLRYDKLDAKLANNDRFAWSFFSEAFRDDVSDAITALMREVEQSVPGRSVIGYLIGGGTDAQLYHWQPPNHILGKPESWGDYSPVARKAWKQWLAAKYGSAQTLSTTWGTPLASFDDAEPPHANDLVGGEFLHDPRKERRAMDWKRFITEGRYKLLSHFAKVIKTNAPRPMVVGVCSGDGGGRRDLTTMEEFTRDPDIDFFLHQVTYGQRIPPNLGGINAHTASIVANGKLFAADWDYPTWHARRLGGPSLAAGIQQDGSVHGWAKDLETLRSMWRREFGYLWATNSGALWNPVFCNLYAFSDPAVAAEMKFLVDTSKTVRASSPAHPVAEVAMIFDEKAVDYLKGGLGVHSEWVRQQQGELNASGVPCGTYYAADLREGKVPPAKMYILQNLMNLDDQLIEALGRLKANGATLVFLRDTGYEQSFSSIDKVSEAVGMTLARIENATPPASRVSSTDPLVNWNTTRPADGDTPRWPDSATLFGPFERTDPLPTADELTRIPASLSMGGTTAAPRQLKTQGGVIDLQVAFGGPVKEGRTAYVYFEVESPKAQTVPFGAGADWWMQWWVNGVMVFDTLEKGNAKPDFTLKDHIFKASLAQGKNIVVARVISGSNGFVLAAGGPREVAAPCLFSEAKERIKKSDYTLAVTDPAAVPLASYADDPAVGFALKEHPSWKSVFIGTRLLSRDMIAALATRAGAWRLTDPGTVSSAAENLIMLHPLVNGPVTVRLKKPASLVECEPGTRRTESAATHVLDLEAGHTYLFTVR